MDAQYKVKGYHFYILYFLCVCCFFEVVLMGVKFIIMMGVVCTQQQHGVAEKEKKTFSFGRKPIFCFFVFCFFPIFFSRVVVGYARRSSASLSIKRRHIFRESSQSALDYGAG